MLTSYKREPTYSNLIAETEYDFMRWNNYID